MKTKLFCVSALALCVIALVACAAPAPTPVPPPDPGSLIKALVSALNAGNLDAAMAFYADDVTRTQQPPPSSGQSGVWTGKDQVRGVVKGMIDDHFNVEISNLKVVGDKATYTCTFSTDSYKKMGVAPLVVLEEAVFEKGKIKSQTITVTPESLAKIQTAMAAAQAKSAAAPDGEVLATKNEDVFGVWLVISASAESHWEHTASGDRVATAISGAMKGYKTTAKYWFEGGLYKIQYPTSTGEANSTAIGTYQVYVTKQGGKAVQLRFVVVDDGYVQRIDRMTYKPWTRVEP